VGKVSFESSSAAASQAVIPLRTQAREALRETLGGATRVGLVNFPNHGNPGDPALWLAAQQLLRSLGVRITYRSAWWDFDALAARRALDDAPILLNGGGSLGDTYAGQQSTRVRVLTEMRDNPIIQLPQSIDFRDPANAATFGDLARAHPDFRLMVREHISVERARTQLGIEPRLSPDHVLALQLDAKLRSFRLGPPQYDVLWMTWGSHMPEHVDYWTPEVPGVRRLDWIDGQAQDEANWDRRGRWALAANRCIQQKWNPKSRWAGVTHRVAAITYDPLATRWVRRGFDYLSTAKVVVTNKLHGHIFSVLAGIPHVVLNNSNGKVSGTLDAWTSGLPGVHRATEGEEAYKIALQLLREMA